MSLNLKPTDGDIERLAISETDPQQARKFDPIQFGVVGNTAIIVFSVVVGFVHALIAVLWRRISR